MKADDIYKFMKSNTNITKNIEQYIRYQDNLANVNNDDWNINILIYNSGNIEYYNDDLKNKYLNCNIYIYGNIAKSEILNKIKGGKHLICTRKNINIDDLYILLQNFKSWFKMIIPANGCKELSANKTIFYYYLYINNYFDN